MSSENHTVGALPPAVVRGAELTYALAATAAVEGGDALLAAVDDLRTADVRLALATVLAMGPPRLADGAEVRVDDEVTDGLADVAEQGTDAIVGAVRDVPDREARIALGELVALHAALIATQHIAAQSAALN